MVEGGVEVSVHPWCQYYIDAKIIHDGKTWRFTGIYGEPRKNRGIGLGKHSDI
jgi:hypothetical protein